MMNKYKVVYQDRELVLQETFIWARSEAVAHAKASLKLSWASTITLVVKL